MGEVGLVTIVVNVVRELRWDLVVMREAELGAIVVNVDEFWGSGGDGTRVCIMWLFLRAWAMRKYVPRVFLRHTIHRDA